MAARIGHRAQRIERLKKLRPRRWLESVTEAEMRMDVGPSRRGFFELLPDLADEDIHRPVPMGHPVAPDLLVDLLARQHLAYGARQQAEDFELAAREVEALLAGVDLEA